MERRRVGKLGAASLVVSLPADWTRFTGIKKGDDVFAYRNGLSLVITPRERKRARGAAEVVLNGADSDCQGALIEVFARYVQGFDSIRVVTTGAPRKNVVALLEAVDSHLLGVEVIEQTAESVTLQVFTREHASLPRLFKRLLFVVKSLSALLVRELRSPKFDSREIKTVAKSAFKLYFLVLRLVYGASRGSRELAESRASFAELVSFALAAKNIGSVLDAGNKVVRSFEELNAPFEEEAVVIDAVERASALYVRCLKAFVEREKIDFGGVRRERRELVLAASAPQRAGLMEAEARVARDSRLLAHDLADRAGELMELAANLEGFEE